MSDVASLTTSLAPQLVSNIRGVFRLSSYSMFGTYDDISVTEMEQLATNYALSQSRGLLKSPLDL
jgi:hypothetical protein